MNGRAGKQSGAAVWRLELARKFTTKTQRHKDFFVLALCLGVVVVIKCFLFGSG
jgi:hypothetical protein